MLSVWTPTGAPPLIRGCSLGLLVLAAGALGWFAFVCFGGLKSLFFCNPGQKGLIVCLQLFVVLQFRWKTACCCALFFTCTFTQWSGIYDLMAPVSLIIYYTSIKYCYFPLELYLEWKLEEPSGVCMLMLTFNGAPAEDTWRRSAGITSLKFRHCKKGSRLFYSWLTKVSCLNSDRKENLFPVFRWPLKLWDII